MKTTTLLARKLQFRCAHLYHQEQFSEQKNQEIFGACFSPHGHGHTYALEVYFNGEVDPLTGMIINLTEIDSLLKETVAPLHDKHLNFEVEYFKSRIPTTENLAHYLWTRLHENFRSPQAQITQLRLYESESLWVDVVAD